MQQQFTDLTDSEWEVIKHIVDNQRKIKHQKRVIFNAILWILTTGSQTELRRWRNLDSRFPAWQFPAWQSVYYHFSRFRRRGVIEEVLDFLAVRARTQANRDECPSVLALDSQSVKIVQFTCEEKGIDGAKYINGRKRHYLLRALHRLAVDCLGIPWAVLVTAGDVSDGAAGDVVMHRLKGKSQRLHTIKADKGYKEGFVERVKQAFGWEVEIVQKPESQKGFVPLGGRWVVERSLPAMSASAGWLNFKRRLSRDFEKTVESSEAMLQLGFIDVLLRRNA
jgi:putative transposase